EMTLPPQGPAIAADVDRSTAQMTEEPFRLLYERTSRALWAYIAKTTGDRSIADDLLQDTYFRFLRSARTYDDEAHARNALYRIATNLMRDARRRSRHRRDDEPLGEQDPGDDRETDVSTRVGTRTDLSRAMAKLRPRDRALLWLAYAQGWS